MSGVSFLEITTLLDRISEKIERFGKESPIFQDACDGEFSKRETQMVLKSLCGQSNVFCGPALGDQFELAIVVVVPRKLSNYLVFSVCVSAEHQANILGFQFVHKYSQCESMWISIFAPEHAICATGIKTERQTCHLHSL